MSTTHKQTVLMLIIVILITLQVTTIGSKPTDGYKQTKINCGNQERIYNCQKCAKITKAVDVYPNCCIAKDVYQWCTDYIYYGHHENFTQPQ